MIEADRGTQRDEEPALRRLLLRQATEADAILVLDRVVPRLARALRGQFPTLAPDDAGDLAREALTVALERSDAFDPERVAGAAGWLYGIARLRAADYFRKRVGDQPLPTEGEPPAIAPEASPPPDQPLSAAVREAIALLPRQQRRAVEAHYLDGRPPREVDAVYGWRPNTANVYLTHARRAMRQKLASLDPAGRRPVALAGGCRSSARLRSRARLRYGVALAA